MRFKKKAQTLPNRDVALGVFRTAIQNRRRRLIQKKVKTPLFKFLDLSFLVFSFSHLNTSLFVAMYNKCSDSYLMVVVRMYYFNSLICHLSFAILLIHTYIP